MIRATIIFLLLFVGGCQTESTVPAIAMNKISVNMVVSQIGNSDVWLFTPEGGVVDGNWLKLWILEDQDCWRAMDEVYNHRK